ncbi:sigma 54-interacting transcriptional regulator [Bacillus tianshenii]|nr:sigma 54-interacting transcriptional regulator [Bacillus tianshenii]
MKNISINDWLEGFFEKAYDGVVIVDNQGFIQYMSENYCSFLKVSQKDVIDKHVTEVIENTRMHIIVQTQEMETADLQYLRGNYVIANRIPIYQNNHVVGAIGTIIFRDLREWKEMNSHIKSLLPELNFLRDEWSHNNGVRYSLSDIVGQSKHLKKLKQTIKRVASSDLSILIRGESGTGKELVAHSIHQLSERSHQPFVKINCGSIPEHLLESELFGYEDGSFTGAKKGGKIGKFQLADGGTIFLDEIGEMAPHMQVKLLRVLQEKEVEPIGAVRAKPVNVRIIAASNRPLEEMVQESKFRKDLFYRLNGLQLTILPLRHRPEDIVPLCEHFLQKVSSKINRRIDTIAPAVLDLFHHYSWPGNCRELENTIQAAAHLSDHHNMITLESLPEYLKFEKLENKGLREAVAATEEHFIRQALRKCHNDKLKAAKSLGISKTSLYDKLKKYNIT